MKALLVALVLAAAAATTHAGRSCEAGPPEAASVQRSLELAVATHRALDASGASVVLLARAGQDLSRYRLRWSHVGWAYRDGTAWRVVHKLNACGSARGDLWRQGLAEFFLDDPFEFRAAFAVPRPEIQARLLAVLRDGRRVQAMHTADYSMLAYPWAQRYQQSNQWAIETLALAHEGELVVFDRGGAQTWLRVQRYEPSVLRLGALTRLGARASRANVAFDDHPHEKRFADRIETVSADSVLEWLQRSGLAGAPVEVR